MLVSSAPATLAPALWHLGATLHTAYCGCIFSIWVYPGDGLNSTPVIYWHMDQRGGSCRLREALLCRAALISVATQSGVFGTSSRNNRTIRSLMHQGTFAVRFPCTTLKHDPRRRQRRPSHLEKSLTPQR